MESCATHPLLPTVGIPVVAYLNEFVLSEQIQHMDPLHQALSKAYRIFVELAWYQCWKQNDRPVSQKTIDAIVHNSNQMLRMLKDRREYRSCFEYSCASQAARLFNPSEPIWAKYVELGLSVGEAAELQSISGTIKALIKLFQAVENDWRKAWYPDVLELRMIATTIRTNEAFEKDISPCIARFERAGRKRTQCLATVCVELIKNEAVDEDLRSNAAKRLSHLVTLVDGTKRATFFAALSDQAPNFKTLRGIAKGMDKYRTTRCMVMQYLEELLKEDKYRQYAKISIDNLRVVQFLTEDEKQTVMRQLARFLTEYPDLDGIMADLNKYLLIDRSVEKPDQEEIQKAQADLQKAEDVKAVIEVLSSCNEEQTLKDKLLAHNL
jgi:hypothetical protein